MATTWATPGTASSRRRTSRSATRRSCIGSTDSSVAVSATKAISPITDEGGARIGGSASGGSDVVAAWSRSATRCRATTGSTPQSNSTQTIEMPAADAERTRRVPETP